MTDLRWGVLGASKFAREHMGPAIHSAVGAQLCAVATRRAGAAAPFQAFAPGCDEVLGYDALLARDDIDAVYVPLPHTLHAEWTVKALEAGKHVLTEKPIAMAVAEFDAMIAARDRSGLMASEAYMIAHHPQWARVRHLIADGAIGTVHAVHAVFTYDNSNDPENIRNAADTGGGGLRDIGVYTLGSARLALGLPLTEITAQIKWEQGFDTFAAVQGQMGSARYSCYVSTRMHLHQEMTFHGTKGLIRMTAPYNARVFGEARIELHQPDLGLRVERFPLDDQYKLQVEAFGRATRGEGYPWTLEDARETQTALDQIFAVATPLDP